MRAKACTLLKVVWLLIVFTVNTVGSDERVLKLFCDGSLDSSAIGNLFTNAETESTKGNRLKFKAISAFGVSFSGEALVDESKVVSVSLWPADDYMDAPNASLLFGKMAQAINTQMGSGRFIADVPNFGDGSDVKSKAMLWIMGNQVLLLTEQVYSNRAGINLVRTKFVDWASRMGADEGDFWQTTLERIGLTAVVNRINAAEDVGTEAQTGEVAPKNESKPSLQIPKVAKPEDSNTKIMWSIMTLVLILAIGLVGIRRWKASR